MKVYEIVKLSQEILNVLQNSCINMGDCAYIGMYEEYESLVADGCKRSMVVSYLSKKYFISERRIYYLIKKYRSECKIGAPQK